MKSLTFLLVPLILGWAVPTGAQTGKPTGTTAPSASAKSMARQPDPKADTEVRINLAYRGIFAPGARAPLFIWQNPSPETPPGYSAGQQIWIGDNPTATPGQGDTVASTIGVFNGNDRFSIWGQNIIAGQCGGTEGCGTDFVDGPVVGLEIDVYGSASWNARNRAFNASSGVYAKNGLEIYAQGRASMTSALSIWADDRDGKNWWHEGIAIARVADVGLHFVANTDGPDLGRSFQVAAILDDSNSAAVLAASGPHAHGIDFRNARMEKVLESSNVRIEGDGDAAFTGTVDIGTLKLAPRKFAELPVCGGPSAGTLAFVTDAAEPVTSWRQRIRSGGGRHRAFIACDGTGWLTF